MLWASPAFAGQYLLDPAYHSGTPTAVGGIDPAEGSPVGSGAITTTSGGGSNQIPIAGTCYASASNGGLSGTGSLAWHFKWYPDTGATYEDDPPFDEVWEFRYTLAASVGSYNPQQTGSTSSSLTVGGHAVAAAGTYTPGSYGMGGYTPPHFTGNPASASDSVVIEVELTGETVTISHDVSATGSAAQGLSAQVSISGVAVNPKDNEAIWHLNPVKNRTYAVATLIEVRGKWRGFQNVQYAIRQSISVPPDYPANGEIPPQNREFGEVAYGTGIQGANRDQAWAGRSIKPDYAANQQGSPYQSNVRLWKWNPNTGNYTIDTGKHSEIPFKVAP